MISCMKRGEHMTEHNAKEIGLRIRRQREALGYSGNGWLNFLKYPILFSQILSAVAGDFPLLCLEGSPVCWGSPLTISCLEQNRPRISATSQTCFPVWMGSIFLNSRNFWCLS